MVGGFGVDENSRVDRNVKQEEEGRRPVRAIARAEVCDAFIMRAEDSDRCAPDDRSSVFFNIRSMSNQGNAT